MVVDQGKGDEPAAALVERPKHRGSERLRARGAAVLDGDQLEKGAIGQEGDPVGRARARVTAAAGDVQTDPLLELEGGGVEVRDGDDQVVDACDHGPMLAPASARHPLGSWHDARLARNRR